MFQRKTTEQFIIQARTVHGGTYDYSKVNYLGNRTNVVISCKKHGEFTQIPSNHLQGKGCKYCSGRTTFKKDLSNVINNDGSRLIPLTQNKYAIVDKEDYDNVKYFEWHLSINKYASTSINGKKVLMHRLILNANDNSVTYDHINRNKLDNRKSNLRVATKTQNARNIPSTRGVSKYKGVCLHKHSKLWHARIRVNNKRVSLGYYKNEIDAAKAYDRKAKEIDPEFFYLNFP